MLTQRMRRSALKYFLSPLVFYFKINYSQGFVSLEYLSLLQIGNPFVSSSFVAFLFDMPFCVRS